MHPPTKEEIDRRVWQTLKDAGEIEPPVNFDSLAEFLDLHRGYYDLHDPNLLDTVRHRLRVGSEKLIRIVKKIDLKAVLLGDEKRILIDQNLPAPKKVWASFHETGHRILNWHQPYFLGDTTQTLDPDFQEKLEIEANYAASSLMFCGPVFHDEACDLPPEWSSIHSLKRRYNTSMVTTLRRYVEHGPSIPMAMMVSTPPWLEIPSDQRTEIRHFIPSKKFQQQFPKDAKSACFEELNGHAHQRRGGPVADFAFGLKSKDGTFVEIAVESFFNSHYLLTLFYSTGKTVRSLGPIPRIDLSRILVKGAKNELSPH